MIDFSKVEENDGVQLVVIKKYASWNEKERQTNYSFFKIGLKKDISSKLKDWVIANFKSVKDKKIIDYNPSVELEDLEKIDLRNFNAWREFEDNAFKGINFKEIQLKQIGKSAVGLVMFVKTNDGVFGQIKRISPSYILSKGLSYILHFDGASFSDLKEETGIRLDHKADFIFYTNKEKSEGIIINKDNFNFVFDVWEEYKKKALSNSKNIKIFADSFCFDLLCQLVESDRQIQRMLINPLIERYLNEISYPELKALKNGAPSLNFEIDEEKQDFILPLGNEKEAIRDLIKAVSGRFGFTINQKHLVENSGVRRILT